MGRKRKGRTGMMRVRLVDLEKLRNIAKSYKLALPDYLSMIVRKKRRK